MKRRDCADGGFCELAAPDPNWAEEVTAIATAVGALGLLGAIVAAGFAGQQVREARRASQAELGADFIRRWNEDNLVEARRLANGFESKEALRDAFGNYAARNAPETYILMRELDYFEQLGALEHEGTIDFKMIELLAGPTMLDRWDLWEPTIRNLPRDRAYPMFEALASKLRKSRSRVHACP
jgi:hypothetical protein